MAVEIINIGVEGNDGTGDSIRQAFQKVNNNFNTLFGIFGLGGSISLVGLDDVSATPVQNAVLTWNDDVANPQVVYKTIVGEGGINVDTVTDPTVIKLQNTASVISLDTSPELAAATKVSGIAAYNDLTYNDLVNEVFYQGDDALQPNRVGLVEQWRATHGQQAMDPSKFLVPKGYTDQTYANLDGDTMSGPLVLPSNTSYTAWSGGVVYTEGDVVTRDDNFYKALADIPSSQNLFDNAE